MILPDVNLLLYAVDAAAPRHAQAREWLEKVLSGTEEVGFAWAVLLGFARISTNPAAFEAPLDGDQAFGYVDEWLRRPVALPLSPGSGHVALVRELL